MSVSAMQDKRAAKECAPICPDQEADEKIIEKIEKIVDYYVQNP